MREKEDYRATLEQLNTMFDHDLLTITEISKFTGLNRHYVGQIFAKELKTYGKTKRINKATLARLMS